MKMANPRLRKMKPNHLMGIFWDLLEIGRRCMMNAHFEKIFPVCAKDFKFITKIQIQMSKSLLPVNR
jgi:hypothetical protein